MTVQEKIIQATSEYFKDQIDYYELSKASKTYKFILEEICDEDMNIELGRNDIHSDNGKSLGTFWAALCLDDIIRTRQFIRGMHKAIQEKMKLKDKIHVLYAGTGPFATLLLPFLLRYSEREIHFSLLEINPFSFKILQNLISRLDLNKSNITFIKDDATKHNIDTKNTPDIILSETMQNALAKEQQVPIFFNLMNQVKEETIFIPERIELSIGLKNSKIPIEKIELTDYIQEKKVFEVSKELIFTSHKNSFQYPTFPKIQTVISHNRLKEFDELLLFTEIQVYKDEKIAINESGLTTPILIDLIPKNTNKAIIETRYIISSDPKLEYQIYYS
ncbi:SAM-dependent methyltransferase [Tenacibaculum jejuense]|uniref:S-adenosyl-L-methionine-dependent methyltransferase family protein n=1 Tax=Tenacibaculum jejuense TaxID=584609 RepID=A0A238UBV4_9FLAO|nr:hypothetical protein [Tenacibaculum jejuense]SNR16466.1 S-adenosyl-L-methionine-dependent methyltransferase family protein [Tenacibaculum jejuense]